MMNVKGYILDHFVSEELRRWLRLKKGRIAEAVRHYKPHVVTRSRGGYEYQVYVADAMAEGWYAWGQSGQDYPLQPEIAFLRLHALKSGALVFDLGAHQCVIATLLAKIVGPTGTVVAVEATPDNVVISRKNRTLNDLDNLQILNVAVSDKPGEIAFLPFNNGWVSEKGGELAAIKVEARTIDSLASEYGTPDVLFIDIEGFELHALRGATRVLESRPDCLVEVHAGCGLEGFGSSVEDVVDVFARRDYTLFWAPTTKDDSHTFEPLDVTALPTRHFFLMAIGNKDNPADALYRGD